MLNQQLLLPKVTSPANTYAILKSMISTTSNAQGLPKDGFTPMFGAIVGDIAGSIYERRNCKSENCEIFVSGSGSKPTDDSVLTIATAQHFLTGDSYTRVYQEAGRTYPDAGYGFAFRQWFQNNNPQPYNSWGNGSAMRASPVGWVATDLDWALAEAARSAQVTHNHPEGIKGAQAVAAAVFLARNGKTKEEIKTFITDNFAYDLDRTVEEIRPGYEFDVSCQGSVPEAIIAFLESSHFEDVIRKAISLGGDSDTIACITGAIAHAFHRTIPDYMVQYCNQELTKSQREIQDEFWAKHQEGTFEMCKEMNES